MIDNNNISTDVVIVGSGPAGLSAALHLLSANMQVVIVEARDFPRDRCGESLHPGIEPLLKHINADTILQEADYLRYGGVWSGSAGESVYQAFGLDSGGPWKGYQAWGADFDSRLQALALKRGVQLVSSKAKEVLKQGDRIIGIETVCGKTIKAKITLDASGSKHWLANKLETVIDTFSPKLIAKTRYFEMDCVPDASNEQLPKFSFDKNGWTWQADIKSDLRCITRLDWGEVDKELNAEREAKESLTYSEIGVRGGDVTWRCVSKLAGEGYFILGDSAMVLDPAASQGVTRALFSGIMTAEYSVEIIRDSRCEMSLALSYDRHMKMRFHETRRNLIRVYREISNPPAWVCC